MSFSKVACLVLGTAGLVAAHGHIDHIEIDGKSYGGYLVDKYPGQSNVPELIAWSTAQTQDAYIQTFDYPHPDVICHEDGKPGALAGDVAAGGKVTLHWSRWFDDHRGPVISYLANCNGPCSAVDKTKLEFFKIAEEGLLDSSKNPGFWASGALMANNLSATVTIPSDIAAGNYVLRHEIIALHNAAQNNGAQAYMQCINLKVSGGGSAKPQGIPATKFYTPTDPGILVDIFSGLTSYAIPGPALYKGGGANAALSPPPTGSSSSQGSGYPGSSSSQIASSATPTPSQYWKKRSGFVVKDRKHARDISV